MMARTGVVKCEYRLGMHLTRAKYGTSFVCTTAHETKGTTRLRSYSLPGELESQVPPTLCQAAVATSAATRFFDPVTIGARKFIDGALGGNNPVVEMEEEASKIWCPDTADLKPLVKCFISIG